MSRLPHICGLCLLLRFWQLLALAPFRIGGSKVAQCQRWMTLSAALRWLLLTSVAPFIVWQSSEIYEATNVKLSTVFKTIALAAMTGDFLISLALLGAHLLNRKELADLVTGLARLPGEGRRVLILRGDDQGTCPGTRCPRTAHYLCHPQHGGHARLLFHLRQWVLSECLLFIISQWNESFPCL